MTNGRWRPHHCMGSLNLRQRSPPTTLIKIQRRMNQVGRFEAACIPPYKKMLLKCQQEILLLIFLAWVFLFGQRGEIDYGL